MYKYLSDTLELNRLAQKQLKVIKKYIINHQITDYLKLLDEDMLMAMLTNLMKCDLDGIKATMYDAIKNELEYRSSDKQLKKI